MTDAGMTGPHDGDHRHGARTVAGALPERHAVEVRAGDGNPRLNGVLVSADDKTGRATAVTRISYSEQDLAALASACRAESQHDLESSDSMSLFDLPFEEPDEPLEEEDRQPPHAEAAHPDRLRAHRARPHTARGALLRDLGRRRAVELPRVEHRPPLLHPQGRDGADQGRDVPLVAAAACVSSRRTDCASSRAAASASTTRRASTRSSASTSSRKASARCSSPSIS